MLVRTIKMFRDKNTKEIIEVGTEFECEDSLAKERIAKKVVEEVKKEIKKPKLSKRDED